MLLKYGGEMMHDIVSTEHKKGITKYHIQKSQKLTTTEMLVLILILQGYSIYEIAELRKRSPKTIYGQKKDIYKKLNIHNDVTLYIELISNGIIQIKKVD